MKGKLVLVTGIGHCGTAWLGHILNHPDQGLFSIHEGMKRWTSGSWKDGVLHYLEHGVDSYFDLYFEKLDRLLETFSFVVDSHSWIPTAVPGVDRRVPVSQVIHLVRNGLRNVDSLYRTFNGPSGEWKGRGGWFGKIIQRELRVVEGQAPKGQLSWSWWGRWWAANQKTVEWMRSQGLKVATLRLEALTEDLNVLTEVLSSFGVVGDPVRLELQQGTRINRHVKERPLADIWGSLSSAQMDEFAKKYMGEMEHYGYGIE